MKTAISTVLISFMLISLTFSQENFNNQPFILRGKIIGQDAREIILKYFVDDKFKIDTAVIRNGEFIFQGNISEPKVAYIIMGNDLNTAKVYLDPCEMNISLTKDKFSEFKMTGSKTQNEVNEYSLLIAPILKQKDYENQLNETDLSFIYSHPKSYFSAVLLMSLDRNEFISLDSLKSVYNKLDLYIQNSALGKDIRQDIVKRENNKIGATAPDFKATDINNLPVTLSEFKGKSVVLLDFWASWCGYCRQSFPHLNEVYRKYHSKGFEIIAVSIDRNREAWISAIKQDSIDKWHNVPIAEKLAEGTSKRTKDDIIENYFVQGIPLKILISRSGIILGRWNGDSKENNESLDAQLAEIFKEK
jgi:thiol-disulfide isomerase/thioredoxin